MASLNPATRTAAARFGRFWSDNLEVVTPDRPSDDERKRLMKERIAWATAVAWLLAAPVLALDLEDKLTLHGYGGWAVGNSEDYEYLAGAGDGDNEWWNADFSLQLVSRPHDRLRLNAQILLETTPDGEEVELRFAAAQLMLSDRFTLQAGLLKHPFGIYNEIHDVGTLRPFYHLPQAVYGPTGLNAKTVAGLALTGRAGDAWELTYDVYAGSLDALLELPHLVVGEHAEESPHPEHRLDDTLGTHLTLQTPLDGLSIGLSAYAGEPANEDGSGHGGDGHGDDGHEGQDTNWGDHRAWGVQAEYLVDLWSVRGEYAVHDMHDLCIDGYYLEVAYRPAESWQVATRYEDVVVDPAAEVEAVALLEHAEWAVGVNYWLGRNLVFKLSFHLLDGNLFAHPHDQLHEVVENGTLEEENRLVVFGTQFSF